jgi:RimJ/RimL family protein N-acetyltransferase
MLGRKLLIGEKVRLAAIEREDVPKFGDWYGNLDLIMFLNDRGMRPFSRHQEEDWCERQHKDRETFNFAIRTLADDRLIGTGGLMNPQRQTRSAELGISIGDPAFWGGGYGSDAVRLLLRYGFLELNFNRIWLRVFSFNLRGIASYTKIGFVDEGRERQAIYRDGAYHDIIYMSVLRREWDARQAGEEQTS